MVADRPVFIRLASRPANTANVALGAVADRVEICLGVDGQRYYAIGSRGEVNRLHEQGNRVKNSCGDEACQEFVVHAPSTVHRIWRAFGLQPHRVETFKLSSDPLFVEKVRDIVGLYLPPPERAVVLWIDEKSLVQALDRTATAADAARSSPTPPA